MSQPRRLRTRNLPPWVQVRQRNPFSFGSNRQPGQVGTQVAAARGDLDRAARLAGAASTLGTPGEYDPAASNPFAHHDEDARASLGENAWSKAWADGAELDLDAALTLALEPCPQPSRA
jgi:hypothetical protein